MGLIILLVTLLTLVTLGALGVIVWALGVREPAYAIARNACWFVAIRGGDEAPALSPNVTITWSGRADFSFIGGGDPYWSRFYVLAGGDRVSLPIDLTNADDAYVAHLTFGAPPRLALGLLKLLVVTGLLGKPRGAVSDDMQAKGYRTELMPDQSAIAHLLAQAQNYAPSMVNFLSYYPSAQDGDAPASSGRAAYARYGMVALRTVYRTGGHLLFFGRITEVVRAPAAGPMTGAWSDVAAMHYPNPRAILSMEHAPDYRAALHHRDKGLARTFVIASTDERLTS